MDMNLIETHENEEIIDVVMDDSNNLDVFINNNINQSRRQS